MSGGSFDYAYLRVVQFADDLDRRLLDYDKVDAFGYTPNLFKPVVLDKLREIERILRKTAALMREVEWLYSGDISEETFFAEVRRIKEHEQ
jgi:hypothetical protein